MFLSSTIIRELALNLAKVTLMFKHSVELRLYLLCCCVAACHSTECFDISVTLARFSASSLMMVEDRNM